MEKRITDFSYMYWDNDNLLRNLCSDCKPGIEKKLEKNKFEVEIDLIIKCVDSQPGDGTKYSYFVFREGYDNFHFMPRHNTFTYPQRLSYWECKDLETLAPYQQPSGYKMQEQLINMAEKHACNPYTLMECIRTMKEIMEKSNENN